MKNHFRELFQNRSISGPDELEVEYLFIIKEYRPKTFHHYTISEECFEPKHHVLLASLKTNLVFSAKMKSDLDKFDSLGERWASTMRENEPIAEWITSLGTIALAIGVGFVLLK